MSQLLKIDSHSREAVARLISQFQGKPRMVKIIETLATRTQTLENCLFQFYERLDLLTSVGNQLDNFGEIVGQDRNSVSDQIYRILLRTKIGINTSQSIPQNLIDIVSELTTKPLETWSIQRTRADILDSRAGLVFRHQPGAKNVLIRVGNDEFLNDLKVGEIMNGFAITSNTGVMLGGFAYRNIGATDLPTIPFIGAQFEFTFSSPMRIPTVKYRGLGNLQFFISTDGIVLTQIENVMNSILQISPAGSRVDYLSVYVPDAQSFAFAGNDDGGGFDQGYFASLYTIPGTFEFDAGEGFGSLEDPLAGGKLIA